MSFQNPSTSLILNRHKKTHDRPDDKTAFGSIEKGRAKRLCLYFLQIIILLFEKYTIRHCRIGLLYFVELDAKPVS